MRTGMLSGLCETQFCLRCSSSSLLRAGHSTTHLPPRRGLSPECPGGACGQLRVVLAPQLKDASSLEETWSVLLLSTVDKIYFEENKITV